MIILNIIFNILVFLFFVYLFLILYLSSQNKKVLPMSSGINEDLIVYIIVSCLNEDKVIYKTLSNLDKYSFKQIIAINDGSNDDTLSEMKKVKSSKIRIIDRRLPNAQIGKGLALNEALKYIILQENENNYNNVIVGVIDADGELDTSAFDKIIYAFSNEDIHLTQLRIKMYDKFKNVLQVMQDQEFFSLNNRLQLARQYVGNVGLSGSGQFFRLETILKKIGNDPWGDSLVDDYELTVNLLLNNIGVYYIDDSYVKQEALSNLKKYIKQRSRWAQGNLECLKFIKKIARNSSINTYQKVTIIYDLIQPLTNLFCGIFLSVYYFTFVLDNYNQFYKILIFIAITLVLGTYLTILYLYDLKKYGLTFPKTCFIFLLPFCISYNFFIYFISLMIAIVRNITGNNTWIKTDRED